MGCRVMLSPMGGDLGAGGKPNPGVALGIVNEAFDCHNPAGTPRQAAMKPIALLLNTSIIFGQGSIFHRLMMMVTN